MLRIVVELLPTFLLIVLGWGLFRSRFLSPAFWREAEKLTYYVLFPALLLASVAKAPLGDLDLPAMAGGVVGTLLLMALALLLARPHLALGGPAFTSVFQGVMRMNTYLGLALAFALQGRAGMEATSIAVALFVPTTNLLCVFVLVRYASAQPGSLGRTLLAIAKNPLILGILGGALLNAAGIGLPPVARPMLEILGAAALGLGLLAVGAGLDLRAARSAGPVVLWTSGVKLLVMPALAAGICWALGLEGAGRFGVVLLAALPTASAAYILARQLGGDAPLMASLITVETALAMLTLPVTLALLA